MTPQAPHIRAKGAMVPSLVILGALGVAGLFGLAVSTGQMIILAALAAPLGLLALVAIPLERVIWLQLAMATVVGGSLAYFGGIGQAQWLPIGVGAVMYLVLLLRLIRLRRDEVAAPVTAPVLLGAAFACVALVSTAWAVADLAQWLYGLRHYFAMVSVFLVLALLPLPAEMLRRLWLALLGVVLLQLPVALYQYVFVVGQRIERGIGGESWDSVVGTMGGNPEGGGQSGAMGFFVIAGFVLMFALWKRRLVSTWQMMGFAAVVLGAILLAEVKFMVFLLPIAVALVLRSELLARVGQVAMGTLVVAILALAMPAIYSKLHYERIGRAPLVTADFYQGMIDQADTERFNPSTLQMGRVSQFGFWWREHSLVEQPKEFLIGHGIAATNQARVSFGTVARQYFPLPVSNTAGVKMLWEVGVIGLGLALAALVLLAFRSLRLSAREELPLFHRCTLEAGAAVLLMLIPILFYRDFALRSPAVQFVLFLAAGQVCYWQSRLAHSVRLAGRARPGYIARPAAPMLHGLRAGRGGS